jgi:hypothetical protein
MSDINNISGSSKIKDTYPTIYNNDGKLNVDLEQVKTDIVAVDSRVDNIITGQDLDPNKDSELVDARVDGVRQKTYDFLKLRLDAMSLEILGEAYGVRWNKTQDSYTRLGSAVTLSVDNTVDPHISGFDDVYPWSQREVVTIDGNEMVKIPKFYYRKDRYTDSSGDIIEDYWIASVQSLNMQIHPAFIRAGVIKDAIYVGAYEAYNDVGTLKSVTGVQPTTGQTIGTFRTQANANGVGWGLDDGLAVWADQLMYLIEYASFFSQNKLGIGITNLDLGTVNHSQNTGHTDVLGNGSGEVTLAVLENGATATAGETYPVKYRGKENPFGNVFEWVDGFITKDDGYYVEDDITNHNDIASGYDHIPAVPITANGYADDVEYLSNFEHAFIPNSVAGSSSTYLTDYLYAHDAGEVNIAQIGGSWFSGSFAGLFDWDLSFVASNVSRYVGARLLYIPEN